MSTSHLSSPLQPLDALVVGGGPAGLSAALYLGRARKRVLVVDRGAPRHAVSEGVHNFITREGLPPAMLRSIAWEQMAPYPTVEHREGTVATLVREGEHWNARLDDGTHLRARAVLLATGVVDEHPEIPGYRERWGHAIHHCPFCHGFELRDEPLALLSSGDAALHGAQLLRGWTDDLVVLTHGAALGDEIAQGLQRLGVPWHATPIARLEGPGAALTHVVLADGTAIARRGLFVTPKQHHVPLVGALELALDEHGCVAVDGFGATALPGLWAAGDLTTRRQQVIEAAAQGARAGAMIVMTLATATPVRRPPIGPSP